MIFTSQKESPQEALSFKSLYRFLFCIVFQGVCGFVLISTAACIAQILHKFNHNVISLCYE